MRIKASSLKEIVDNVVNVTPVVSSVADEESELVPVKHSKKSYEESLRLEIRRMIQEELESETPEPARSTETLKAIADEFELSISGAKRLVDVTVEKAAKIAAEYAQDEDFELTVLNSIKDYIEHLRSSGELDEADVTLLYSHPEIVRELDGFREFLAPKIKRYLKAEPAEQ